MDVINTQLDTRYPFFLDSETVNKATPYKVTKGHFESIDKINAECKFIGGGISQQMALMGAKFSNGEVVPADQLKKC